MTGHRASSRNPVCQSVPQLHIVTDKTPNPWAKGKKAATYDFGSDPEDEQEAPPKSSKVDEDGYGEYRPTPRSAVMAQVVTPPPSTIRVSGYVTVEVLAIQEALRQNPVFEWEGDLWDLINQVIPTFFRCLPQQYQLGFLERADGEGMVQIPQSVLQTLLAQQPAAQPPAAGRY